MNLSEYLRRCFARDQDNTFYNNYLASGAGWTGEAATQNATLRSVKEAWRRRDAEVASVEEVDGENSN